MEKKWYGTYEVARLLGVHPGTVWHWCKKGRVKAGRTPGGHYRIPREEVERLIRELNGEENWQVGCEECESKESDR